ncbi:hypothetical protein HF313_28065 [Massilia atriviolacea]|uniref:Uncharacterized protein n=1 Tax=Massilia atriviolacea TaxID=2495579 RepID=A0A430HJT1_9BURK|nr:hypothetical protein [Massilia atriviolacea]RSZ57751.1 hypothetical protein EJB06_18920 [Massilia atriviolacea]
MAHRWETPGSIWLEDEHTAQFELASSEGLGRIERQAQSRGRLPDIAHLLGASLPLACDCSPIYPEGFAFCPTCGAALDKLAGRARTPPDWWGPWSDQLLPRHVPHGLNVTSLALGDSVEERPAAPAPGRPDASMPAPPNAHCVFAAGTYGFPAQRLIALAHARNVLQYWDPLARAWHVMAPEDNGSDLTFSAPAASYAWLPAPDPRRGEVGLVPTDRGLRRLFINPVSETYRTETVFDGLLASAPGAMRRHLACLVNGESGTRLWSAGSDMGNQLVYECDAPAGQWARPFGYDGKLFWLHAQGQLVWQPGAPPQWIAWPAGWSPRQQFGGPTQSRDGRLWLIGHDGQAYSFLELGKAAPQREELSGARLGFASLLFRRGHAVVGEPWGQEHVEDPHDDDAMVLPLLRGFNNNRSQPSGLVLRFHQYTGMAEDALAGRIIARTTLEWIGKRNVILDDIARLARPLDCVPFVYDNCLWLHHPDWNQVRGWQLDALP